MFEYLIIKAPILHSFHPSRPGNLSRLWSQLANALPNHSIHNSTVNSATQVFCHANQCDAIRQLSQQNQDGRSRGRTCGRRADNLLTYSMHILI